MLAILLIILFFIFDSHIISFLSQFKTTQTLLQYSDFWNQRLHDWLGDTITLVGVMLAFSLPFTAQVVQWIVSTYGVNSFPEIIKDKLKINQLLKEMFIFVGVVIFWRVFIYDISPYSASLYILFNLAILIYFVWILVKLFKVINYILKCTFSFQEFVIDTAYKHIENTSNSIPTPFSEITDISIIPELSPLYLQNLELLRDYEISKFKRGDIFTNEKLTFDYYVWTYIQASLATDDSNQLKQAVVLQKKLSTSIVRMCTVSSNENYEYYINFARRLAYYSFKNRYYTLDERLTSNCQNPHISLPNKLSEEELFINKLYNEEQAKIVDFDKYFSDLIFLAENIESKNINVYCPILSCQYLSNYSSIAYKSILPQNIAPKFNWKTFFDRIDKWENDIIEVTKRLIEISSRYKKSSPLEMIYDNLRNDLQFSHNRQFEQSRTPNVLDFEAYRLINEINKINKINNEEEIDKYYELLSSDEFNHKLGFLPDEKKENLLKLLRIRYKFKVDKLILVWLKHLSFDTSIVIKILEKASPIDKPRTMDIGNHLMPTTIGATFKLYLSANDLEFNNFISNSDSDSYQIIFNTMILYFLTKYLRHQNTENKIASNELASDIARNIYSVNGLTIRNIKSINEIAKLGEKQLKGIDSNQGIKDLCINYGISFGGLKNLYTNVLICLKEQSKGVIDKKTADAPIDQDAIDIFYKSMKEHVQILLDNHVSKEHINNADKEKRSPFLSINREWFIKADTGTYYLRDDLLEIFKERSNQYFRLNNKKTMVIFGGKTEPTINFEYKKVGLKLFFYCKYNFYFK